MNFSPQSILPIVHCLTVILTCLPGISLEGAKEATLEEIESISLAIPDKIEPRKKHKVLVFSKAFTYYHSSIAVAKEMAKQLDMQGLGLRPRSRPRKSPEYLRSLTWPRR